MRPLPVFVLVVGVLLFGAAGAVVVTETVLRTGGAGEDGRPPVELTFCDEDGQTPRRGLRRLLCGGKEAGDALASGIFRAAPLDVPALMPAPPAGWTRSGFAMADAEALTGRAWEDSRIATGSPADEIIGRLHEASEGRKMSAAATYRHGDRTILLAIDADMKAIRRAEAGEVRRIDARVKPVALTLDGVAVWTGEPFDRAPGGTLTPVPWVSYHAVLDGMVRLTVLTDAAEADVLALLSGLDMAALQAGLPVTTTGFAAGGGGGAVWVAGLPSDTPRAPLPWRAAQALAAGDAGLKESELSLVRDLARGQVTDWAGALRRLGADAVPSKALVDLMGPPPAHVTAAVAAHAVPADGLTEADRLALTTIGAMRYGSQASLARSGIRIEALSPEVAAVVAILPERPAD